MSARETGDLPTCVLCGSLNGIIDRQVMPLSITRGPGHRELWSVMACERCAVAIVENNSKGTGASTSPGFDSPSAHPVSTSDAPVPAPPPPAPAQAGWTEVAAESIVKMLRPHDGESRHRLNVEEVLDILRARAPKVRVKLPDWGGGDPTDDYTRGYRDALDRAEHDIRAALRQAGVEIEGEQ